MGSCTDITYQRNKNHLLRNIVEDIEDYWEAFHNPVPFQFLSRRYSKRALKLGLSFRTAVRILEDRRVLFVEIHPTLRRDVWLLPVWENGEP